MKGAQIATRSEQFKEMFNSARDAIANTAKKVTNDAVKTGKNALDDL